MPHFPVYKHNFCARDRQVYSLFATTRPKIATSYVAAMLVDNQAFKMAAARGVLDENIQYSDYFAGLEGPAKSRYKEKITVCGFDPYALRKSDFFENIELLPNVQYPDIVNYLVLQTSRATKTQMKAYKSMDAYNFFVSGWVNTLCLRSVDTDKVLVFARVGNVTFLSDNL